MDCMSFSDVAEGVVERARPEQYSSGLAIGGEFHVQCFGPDGVLKWEDTAKNMVVLAALDDVLNVYLRNQAPVTQWYLGLVDNAGFTAFANTDSMTSHTGWSEVASGNYSDATRIAWSPGASSGQTVTNGTTCDFHMTPTSALTVRGLFLVSDSTKGGTAGKLFATAAFSGGNQTCNNGDTLKTTYSVSSSST
jgi:hypothetical protein